MLTNPAAIAIREELTRRRFLCGGGSFAASAALASLLAGSEKEKGESRAPHFAPRAKRVISLFMSGGPSHVDLFDYKPQLRVSHGQQIPDTIQGGKRLSTMTGGQKERPVLAPISKFAQRGYFSGT